MGEKATEAVCYIKAQGLPGHMESFGLSGARRNLAEKAGCHWLWEDFEYPANDAVTNSTGTEPLKHCRKRTSWSSHNLGRLKLAPGNSGHLSPLWTPSALLHTQMMWT